MLLRRHKKAEAVSNPKPVRKMTKAELVAYAKELGLEVDPNLKKDELLEVILPFGPDLTDGTDGAESGETPDGDTTVSDPADPEANAE